MGNRNPKMGAHLSTARGANSALLRGWCFVPTTGVATAIAITITLVAGAPVFAEESSTEVISMTPGTSYSRSAPAGWRAGTRVDDADEKIPRPKSLLTIRTYEGFGKLRPFYGAQPATGVNVTAEMETCPDGNTRISGLDIGGWLFAVDGDCSNNGQRLLSSVSQPDDGEEDEENQSDEPVLHCDPATWRCRTIDR